MMIKSIGLTEKMLTDIKELENECCSFEKLTMKLNWELLRTRSVQESNDFLYYLDDKLVGNLGLYGFGPKPKEIELTGMVHPDYRRRGIFSQLFREAKKECSSRTKKILIITERCSSPGIVFSRSTDAQYSFSEYHMIFDKTAVPAFINHGITLRKADKNDSSALTKIDKMCFGEEEEASDENRSFADDPLRTQYVIESDGITIGKIGVITEEEGYIFGFGIKPEYRGRGFGRAALSMTLEKLLALKLSPVVLEVAVKNENALSLYKSCGFKEDTIYDYYELNINE